MDRFQAKIAEFYRNNLHKEVVIKPPGFVRNSSFLTFVLNGFFRLLAVFVICGVLLTIAVQKWADELILDRWIDPFFSSDILETDCVSVNSNIIGYLNVIHSKPGMLDYEAVKSYQTDYIAWLYEQRPVEKVYGFNDCYVSLDKYKNIPLKLGTPETFDMLQYELVGNPLSSEPEDDYPEVLLSGASFSDYKPGDIITLTVPEDYADLYMEGEYVPKLTSAPLQCRVAGKIAFPYRSVDQFFYIESSIPYHSNNKSTKIFMLYNEKNLALLKEKGFYVSGETNNYYVKYKDDASQADISFMRNYLNNKYQYNMYEFVSSPNILPTASVIEGTIKQPAPRVFRTIIPPVPLLLAAICAVLLILAMTSVISSISTGRTVIPKERIVVGDIVKTSILFTAAVFVIPFMISIIRYVSATEFYPYCDPPASAWAEMLFSSHIMKLAAAILVMMAMIIIPSIIFSIRKMKSTAMSKQKTREAYSYRQPEYYTPDSYVPNDFEKADYDLINRHEPEDIAAAVSRTEDSPQEQQPHK